MKSRFSSSVEALDLLHAMGFVYPDATQGFQYDIVSAFKPAEGGAVTQGSLCGLNCTTQKGGYSCGMASSLNRGISKSTFAPASFILDNCAIVEQGLDQARNWFLDSRIVTFCDQMAIQDGNARGALRQSFTQRRTEANLFGGDPEQHPEVVAIVRGLKRMGMKVNLTATGVRWLNDETYVDQLMENPPNVICLSLDEMRVTEFMAYCQMSPAELKHAYNALDKAGDADYGQKKKAIAGFYVARRLSEMPSTVTIPPVLFNCVLSHRNIHTITEIAYRVERSFNRAILNPYPGQGSFNYESVEPNIQYLKALRRFVNDAIVKTLEGGRFVKRLHYWLILKAAFNHYGDNWPELARAMHGYGLWTCYREPMAGFYVQPARSEQLRSPIIPVGRVVRPENVDSAPGGYLGCTWNANTVTEDGQISTPELVADHILGHMTLLAAMSRNPCEGCLMPRLMFNYVSSMLGLNPALRHETNMLRKEAVGF
jgi:hypothetical protein